MKKCYIYTRVSTEAQIEGYSLEAQEESLKNYAEYRELKISGNYCDAGKSGKNIKGRPEFKRMMSDIIAQKDDISFVLVFKLSRFGRNAADVLKSLQTLESFGVDLVSVEESIDSSTQGGRLTLAILSAVAEMERENIASQFMASKLQKVKGGGWCGGQAPYGYSNVNRELVIKEDEAEVVIQIFDLYLQGEMTISSVVNELNNKGITLTDKEGRKKPFTYSFVSVVLNNPIYCGEVIYNRRTNRKDRDGKIIKKDYADIVRAEGKHQAIITKETWERAQKKRTAVAEKYKKVNEDEHVHLLSGIVKCPVCGKKLQGVTAYSKNKNSGKYYDKRIYYYKCRYSRKQEGQKCSFKCSLNQQIIDELVISILNNLQLYGEFERELKLAYKDNGNLEETENSLQISRKRLRNLGTEKVKVCETLDGLNPLGSHYDEKYDKLSMKLDDIYDRIEDAESEIGKIKKKFEILKEKTESVLEVREFIENISSLFTKLSGEEKKKMLGLFVDAVEIFPEDRKDGRIIKSISFKFPVAFRGVPLEKEINSDEMVSFKLDCSKIDIKLPEKGKIIIKTQEDGSRKYVVRKGTYKAIKEYILDKYRIKVSTLYIAQTKRKYGLEVKEAYNKPEHNKNRIPQCTKEKELMIVDALKYYDLLDEDIEYMGEMS